MCALGVHVVDTYHHPKIIRIACFNWFSLLFKFGWFVWIYYASFFWMYSECIHVRIGYSPIECSFSLKEASLFNFIKFNCVDLFLILWNSFVSQVHFMGHLWWCDTVFKLMCLTSQYRLFNVIGHLWLLLLVCMNDAGSLWFDVQAGCWLIISLECEFQNEV